MQIDLIATSKFYWNPSSKFVFTFPGLFDPSYSDFAVDCCKTDYWKKIDRSEKTADDGEKTYGEILTEKIITNFFCTFLN